MKHFHTPSTLLAEHAQNIRKYTLQLIRKMKSEYYGKKVEEATSQNIWTFCKWTTTNQMYTSPPRLRRKQPTGSHTCTKM